jgi:hypothetical protein
MFLLFLEAYKFNICYEPFPKNAAPPPRLPKPVAAQKTPWLTHLLPRLRMDVGHIPEDNILHSHRCENPK